jgi:AcrR family transcriptional regulator
MRYPGRMARLTRAETQARTREALVHTATRAFLRDGYLATSLDKVADEAGYSKGAVYSNFRNKNQLCLAVLDEIHAEQARLIEQAMSGSTTLGERLAAFHAWAERTIGDPAWTGLEIEFATHVRHDPALRAELAEREATMRALVAGVIRRNAEELDLALPMPAHEAAAALLSLGIGLGVRRMVEPSTPVDALTDMAGLLFGGSGPRR